MTRHSINSNAASSLNIACGSFRVLSAVLLLCLFSCAEDRTYEYEEKTMPNHAMQQLVHDNYLWGDSIKDLKWNDYFAPTVDFLKKLTAQAPVKDSWSFCTIDTVEQPAYSLGMFNSLNSYGLDVVLMSDPTGETTRQFARVTTVFPGSPAERCGLQRGDFIAMVDNGKMSNTVMQKLKSGRSLSLVVNHLDINPDDATFFWQSTDTVRLEQSERVGVATVLAAKMVYDAAAYLMLSNLENVDEILSAINHLKTKEPVAWIVDLRLCSHGTIESTVEVARALVATQGTLLKTIWATKRSDRNMTYSLEANAGGNNAGINGNAINGNSINEDTPLFFITSPSTQGAAEWLVKGLRTLEPDRVAVVGRQTAGQNLLLTDIPSQYGYTLHLATAYVADGEGNHAYGNGIQPDEPINELDYVFLYPYGDERETILYHIFSNY